MTRNPDAFATTGLFILALGAVLYIGRSVFTPLTIALMLSFVLGPLVRALRRLRIPQPVAALLVVLGLACGVGAGLLQVSVPASAWATRMPQTLRTIELKIRPLKRPVDQANRLAEQVERITSVDASASAREVHLHDGGLASVALESAIQLVTQAAIAVFALYFLLTFGDPLLERVICLLPDLGDRARAAELIRHIERRMSLYLGTVTLIYASLGAAVGTAAYFFGLPNPALWGVLAALLHYVPYVGSAVGIGIVGLASLTTFAQLSDAALPPLAYLALATLEGHVITPIVLGRTFALSPLIIFMWLVFWGWLWGIAGALIAVPMLMLVKITCEQSRSLAPIAAFLHK
jgi:predicted PurR-regulated permease PerM